MRSISQRNQEWIDLLDNAEIQHAVMVAERAAGLSEFEPHIPIYEKACDWLFDAAAEVERRVFDGQFDLDDWFWLGPDEAAS